MTRRGQPDGSRLQQREWRAVLCGLCCLAPTSCLFPDYQVGGGGLGGAAVGGAAVGASGGTLGIAGAIAGGGTAAAGSASSGASGTGGAGTSGAGVGGATTHGGTAGTSGTSGTSGGEGGASGIGGDSAGAGGTDPGNDVLVADDFEDGDDAGWFATSGDWSVVTSGDSRVYRVEHLLDQALYSVIGELGWTNVAIEARVRVLEWGGASSSDLVAIFARFDSPTTHYYVALRADGKLAIRKKQTDNATLGTPVDLGLELDTDYLVRFEVLGATLNAYVDGSLVLTVTDSALTTGRVALGTDNARAEFDDVKVTRLP